MRPPATPGKVYEIGPEVEHEGSIESDVFDAAMYTLWGRLSFEAHLNGGQIAVVTRSGNLDQPQKNWSPGRPPSRPKAAGQFTGGALRAMEGHLTADSAGHSPELESVDVAYLPKNVEPRVDEIEITPANYRFPAPVLNLSAIPSGPRRPHSAARWDGEPRNRSAALPRRTPPLRHHAVRQGLPGRALAGLRPQWRQP
jgi:hypothetical protein